MMSCRRAWTSDEIAILREEYADMQTASLAKRLGRTVGKVYQKAAALGLKKSASYLASPQACRLRHGDNVGSAYRFRPGHATWNKGMKGVNFGGKETQFKKGNRSGMAQKIYQPVGAERVSKDGYIERKINDDMPLQKRWRAVHILIWEAVNGPLPPGHAICFKDGDKRNLAMANLELINRAELMRRNSYHTRYPKEIGLAIQARGQLIRQINRRSREKQD